jgi:hypothetical protein
LTEGSEDGSCSENEKTEAKPLKSLSVSSNDDAESIEPKKLHNPVLSSKPHLRLHKELKLTHARGGIQSILGKPELERVMQRRRPDADGKVGSIRPAERSNITRGSCMDNELETQLARRSKAINTERISESQKPEFMNVALRKTPKVQ